MTCMPCTSRTPSCVPDRPDSPETHFIVECQKKKAKSQCKRGSPFEVSNFFQQSLYLPMTPGGSWSSSSIRSLSSSTKVCMKTGQLGRISIRHYTQTPLPRSHTLTASSSLSSLSAIRVIAPSAKHPVTGQSSFSSLSPPSRSFVSAAYAVEDPVIMTAEAVDSGEAVIIDGTAIAK